MPSKRPSSAKTPSQSAGNAAAASTPDPDSLHSFPNATAWEQWLEQHHTTSGFIWVQFTKTSPAKGSGATVTNSALFTHPQALEIALCFGWIDGQKQRVDELTWAQKFGPRGPRSIWSVKNRDAAEKLIAAGRMRPAGHAAIEHAQANGAWDSAYLGPSKSTVPEDLQAALDAHPAAAAFFKTLSSQNRYAILFRLQTAKKPETRQVRLQKFVQMLLEGKTLH